MMEWTPHLRRHFASAKEAYANAVREHACAELLRTHGHYGPSAALAVIGVEEVGKAAAYVLLGLGLIDENRQEELAEHLRNHTTKQFLGQVGYFLGRVGPRIARIIERIPDESMYPEGALVVFASRLARHLIKRVARLMLRGAAMWVRFDAVGRREFQNLKNRGLYVDFVEGTLTTPLTVTDNEARAAADDLKTACEGIRWFVGVADFTDDGVRTVRRFIEDHWEIATGQPLPAIATTPALPPAAD